MFMIECDFGTIWSCASLDEARLFRYQLSEPCWIWFDPSSWNYPTPEEVR